MNERLLNSREIQEIAKTFNNDNYISWFHIYNNKEGIKLICNFLKDNKFTDIEDIVEYMEEKCIQRLIDLEEHTDNADTEIVSILLLSYFYYMIYVQTEKYSNNHKLLKLVDTSNIVNDEMINIKEFHNSSTLRRLELLENENSKFKVLFFDKNDDVNKILNMSKKFNNVELAVRVYEVDEKDGLYVTKGIERNFNYKCINDRSKYKQKHLSQIQIYSNHIKICEEDWKIGNTVRYSEYEQLYKEYNFYNPENFKLILKCEEANGTLHLYIEMIEKHDFYTSSFMIHCDTDTTAKDFHQFPLKHIDYAIYYYLFENAQESYNVNVSNNERIEATRKTHIFKLSNSEDLYFDNVIYDFLSIIEDKFKLLFLEMLNDIEINK